MMSEASAVQAIRSLDNVHFINQTVPNIMMKGFERRISGFGIYRSANYAEAAKITQCFGLV